MYHSASREVRREKEACFYNIVDIVSESRRMFGSPASAFKFESTTSEVLVIVHRTFITKRRQITNHGVQLKPSTPLSIFLYHEFQPFSITFIELLGSYHRLGDGVIM